MAFAAVVGPREEERIVATSCYYLDPATGLADVAYLVDPDWQGAGLGTLLHARTVEYARQHGVRGFTADVLLSNAAMLRVFQRGDHETRSTVSGESYEVTMGSWPSEPRAPTISAKSAPSASAFEYAISVSARRRSVSSPAWTFASHHAPLRASSSGLKRVSAASTRDSASVMAQPILARARA